MKGARKWILAFGLQQSVLTNLCSFVRQFRLTTLTSYAHFSQVLPAQSTANLYHFMCITRLNMPVPTLR